MNLTLSKRDLLAIQIAKDYESKTNLEYSEIIKKKIGILLELMESLVEEKISTDGWKGWSESLIQKMSIHSVTLLDLFKGTFLPFGKDKKQLLLFDKPSILVLLRTILECYLTFYYLHIDEVTDEEKKFRLTVWRYAGLKQRSKFVLTSNEAIQKQLNEKELVDKLNNEIKESMFITQFDSRDTKEIMSGRKPRLNHTWLSLVEKSGLRLNLFKNLYSYKSSYSHSEFVSILQIKDGVLKFDKNEEVGYELFLLHFIISKTIIDVMKLFPSIRGKYNELDEELRIEIEIMTQIATGKTA